MQRVESVGERDNNNNITIKKKKSYKTMNQEDNERQPPVSAMMQFCEGTDGSQAKKVKANEMPFFFGQAYCTSTSTVQDTFVMVSYQSCTSRCR